MIFSTEHQLILDIISENVSPQDLTKKLEQSIDWPHFLSEAVRHGVAPWIYHILESREQSSIPASVIEQLKNQYHQTAFLNLLLFENAKPVFLDLSKKEIPVILFKGSALIQEIYGNAGLRPCADIDMLVPRETLNDVKKVFFVHGFKFPDELLDESFYYQNHFHIPFRKNFKQASILIEVHWNLMDKYLLKGTHLPEIIQRKKPLNFEGIPLFGLSNEDELLYIALHTLKHGYMNPWIAASPENFSYFFDAAAENKLMWFLDLKKLLDLRKDSLNWDELSKRAQQWGIFESVRVILILLKKIFPTVEIPENILCPQSPIKISFFRKTLYKTLLTRSRNSNFKKNLLQMQGDLQFRPIRAFDMLGYMFPSISDISKIYRKPKWSSPLIYPLHILKTFYQGLYGLLQLIALKIWKSRAHHH